MKRLDVYGKSENAIARNLSNMAKHEFVFRGFKICSAESVLQSTKYKNPYLQLFALSLSGTDAQKEGRNYNWKNEQKLYWFGKEMIRESREYQKFIDEVYICLLKNESFKENLLKSDSFHLVHTIGCDNPRDTILTEYEFCNRLVNIREFILISNEYDDGSLKAYLAKMHEFYKMRFS